MALAEVNLFSPALMRTVPIYAIIPCDKMAMDGTREKVKPFKTLYLLHGIFGNYTDWVTGTRILRWASDHNLAVIMPSGDNKFYLWNRKTKEDYSKFIKELVEITRDMFNLSDKREDTYIGGLSMGGYGSLINGLKYSDLFSRIIALSSAVEVHDPKNMPEVPEAYPFGRSYLEYIFGDEPDLMHSEKEPGVLAESLVKKGKELPEIYLACGTEDDMYPANKKFGKKLEDLGYRVTWKDHKGGHDWDFWDWAIEDVIKNWLPLEADAAISSGNIGKDNLKEATEKEFS